MNLCILCNFFSFLYDTLIVVAETTETSVNSNVWKALLLCSHRAYWIINCLLYIYIYIPTYLLLQSALQPLVGFRPAQLSLSILSRKVLQSAVPSGTSNPQLGGALERSNFRHKRPPASEATLANLAAECGTMGEKWPKFAESDDFHVTFGFFYMP
jgi:hypothetical protein